MTAVNLLVIVVVVACKLVQVQVVVVLVDRTSWVVVPVVLLVPIAVVVWVVLVVVVVAVVRMVLIVLVVLVVVVLVSSDDEVDGSDLKLLMKSSTSIFSIYRVLIRVLTYPILHAIVCRLPVTEYQNTYQT